MRIVVLNSQQEQEYRWHSVHGPTFIPTKSNKKCGGKLMPKISNKLLAEN